MKLQAVTVCINYADYLVCIVENRRHFDRWIVMTVPGDTETVAVCEAHGIEWRFSRTLKADGSDFNAAFNKSGVINEGLEALDADGWVVLIDSDVRLPRHFRERVSALPLECGAMYGAAGRKLCDERAMFDMLVECEPWDRFCDRQSGIFGYFNLFDLAGKNNRYPVRDESAGGQHDDGRFQDLFSLENRRTVPMTVIHTGRPWENWHRRASAKFTHTQAVMTPFAHEARPVREMADLPEDVGGRAAFVGYFPGMQRLPWLKRFARVDLVDHFQVHTPSASVAVEADRAVLRRVWEEETAGCASVHLLGPHSAGTMAKIPDGSLDCLYLPGEIAPDWMVPALPLWLAKLKDGAVVCGDLFNTPHWPDSTYGLSLLMGVPDEVSPTGFWWKRFHRPVAPVTERFPLPMPERVEMGNPAEPSGDAVVFVNKGAANLERLFLSLHSLRRHWSGAVAVYHWGEVDHSLAITCARYRVSLHNVGHGFTTQFGRTEDLVWEATEVSPYLRVLYVPTGMLFQGDPSALFSETKQEIGGKAFLKPHVCIREGGSVKRMAVSFAEATLLPSGAKPCLVVCEGEAERWDDVVWESWCENEVAMTGALACPVRTPVDAAVVVIVDADSQHDFERNWPAWKFTPTIPIYIALDGLKEADIWLADGRRPNALVSLPAGLDELERFLSGKMVVCLAPEASPMPGADLLTAARWPGSSVYLHSPVSHLPIEEESKKTKMRIPLFAIGKANEFLHAMKRGLRGHSPKVRMADEIRRHLLAEKTTKRFDAWRLGWRFAGTATTIQPDPLLARLPADLLHAD